jgi:PQQ-like domain
MAPSKFTFRVRDTMIATVTRSGLMTARAVGETSVYTIINDERSKDRPVRVTARLSTDTRSRGLSRVPRLNVAFARRTESHHRMSARSRLPCARTDDQPVRAAQLRCLRLPAPTRHQRQHPESDGRTIGLIFALAASDGHLVQAIKTGNYTDFSGYMAAPQVVGRLLILSHTNVNKLTAHDRFNGRLVWTLLGDPGWGGFGSPPTVRGDTLFAASGDRRVYAIHALTGALYWKSEILDGSQSETAVCGPFVLSWAGLRTAVLDRRTGAQISVLDKGFDFALSYTTPPVSADSDLFVMSQREVRRYTC